MSIEQLAGHRFAGGQRTIEHWENFLLTEACGGPQLPDRLAHPAHLFHVPLDGARVSIAELFELAEAEGPDRVGLESYDWEYFAPLREGVVYTCSGEVVSIVPRRAAESAWDELVFAIELHDGERLVARVTNTWQIWRSS